MSSPKKIAGMPHDEAAAQCETCGTVHTSTSALVKVRDE